MLSAPANTVIGAAVSANPATTLRLVMEVETACAMASSLMRTAGLIHLEHAVWSELIALSDDYFGICPVKTDHPCKGRAICRTVDRTNLNIFLFRSRSVEQEFPWHVHVVNRDQERSL
jgi:hypothetical protein